ncbi:hypothetical protein B566_EDAN014608 [Ephemera danica]|nr:hypothetical protein B566_EDAN014608 [Ephemera danica]
MFCSSRIDTKDGYSGFSSKMLELKQLKHILEPCEIITTAASSTVSSNIQYIGTTHHLFSMDIRKPGQVVQSWTHLMHGPPQYIGLSCDMPNREIICLGNTERSEVITLVNEWLDGVPYSRTQPYALSSIGETLTEAKLRGLCLNPKVQSRLKLSLTGICCTSSSSPAVFTSTAAGDVFCQRVTPRFADQDVEEENLAFKACLTYWQEKVIEVENSTPRKPLFFNECKTASRLLKRSFCHQSTEPSKNLIESQPVRPTWILPVDLLFNSKDEAQAARILKAWGITDQKSWDRLHSEALAGLPSSTVQPGQLVEKWLTENPMSQHDPDTQDSQILCQPFGSQMSTIEHFSVSQQPSTSHWQQNTKPPSEVGSDIMLQTQMSARRKTGVPKVKNGTDGF